MLSLLLYSRVYITITCYQFSISIQGRKSHIRIHEDASGGIYVVGVNTKPVNSLFEVSSSSKHL